ncbi:MAG: hypothetical protein KME23_21420 [Goleter apudmare HA4340-LM2]|jgi:hypothetical protein|nr:hypothetical protein [Goleter apudmare HA4340-LM2]
MQEYSTTEPTSNQADVGSVSHNNISINGAIALIVVLIPITIFAGLKTYKKYRAATLRQQIASLEKLWHLDTKKKKA